MMETSSSNNEANAYYPLTIIKTYNNSNLQLSLPYISIQSQKSPSIKLAIRKDERLEYLNIPKGLIELLQINGFTV